MESNFFTWKSQRNERKWAVVFFFCILLILVLSSCQVQQRYHQRGWHFERNTYNALQRGEKASKPSTLRHHLPPLFFDDSSEEMHISQRLINAGKLQKWVYRDTSIHHDLTKQLRTMTVVGDTFTMHGKLVAANENGIFLFNPHDPLFWVSKKPYGKTQTAIRDKVLFVPYTDIQEIKKGGTLASKLERVLNGLFWFWFSLGAALGGFWSIGVFGNSPFILGNTLEAIIGFFVLIAYLATLVLTVVLSLILTPILFLLQLPVARLKGRYWAINKRRENGLSFLAFIKSHHDRYRLYRRDIEAFQPDEESN